MKQIIMNKINSLAINIKNQTTIKNSENTSWISIRFLVINFLYVGLSFLVDFDLYDKL